MLLKVVDVKSRLRFFIRNASRFRNFYDWKVILAVPVIMLLFIVSSFRHASAFHEGGEGYCEGCHILHEFSKDKSSGTEYGRNSEIMTRDADASSTCPSVVYGMTVLAEEVVHFCFVKKGHARTVAALRPLSYNSPCCACSISRTSP